MRRSLGIVHGLATGALAVAVTALGCRPAGREPGAAVGDGGPQPAEIRTRLFAEIQPVVLANCELARFGEAHDGGYLMCGNLLRDVEAAYSYGIGGHDGWGCDVSRRLGIRTHQYDCFDTRAPLCPGGDTVFHASCVGDSSRVEDGRPFDAIAGHLASNGDAGARVVVKIDAEGAEWDALLAAPDGVLGQIDQLVVEFHDVADETFVAVLRKLKQHFHVAHLHFNNYACQPDIEPFPAWAYETLFVSRRLGVVDASRRWDGPSVLDAPNDPERPDCQP